MAELNRFLSSSIEAQRRPKKAGMAAVANLHNLCLAALVCWLFVNQIFLMMCSSVDRGPSTVASFLS